MHLAEAVLPGAANRYQGRASEFWMIPGDPAARNVYNAVCYGARMVGAMERLLGDGVSLYHRKLVMKDAASFAPAGQHSGNAWRWHQVWGAHTARDHAQSSPPTHAAAAAAAVAAAAAGLRLLVPRQREALAIPGQLHGGPPRPRRATPRREHRTWGEHGAHP
jgi:hypothetical protein